MTLPQRPNQRWSLDFVSDTLACSRRIRILAVVGDFTRENLALVVDTSLSGARGARELDAIIAVRGKPLMMVSDNGTEHQSGNPALVAGPADRVALHRAGQPGCDAKLAQQVPAIAHYRSPG